MGSGKAGFLPESLLLVDKEPSLHAQTQHEVAIEVVEAEGFREMLQSHMDHIKTPRERGQAGHHLPHG